MSMDTIESLEAQNPVPPPIDIKSVIKQYNKLSNRYDRDKAKLTKLYHELDDLEQIILAYGKKNKMEKFSIDGVSATIADSFRAKYDPAQWAGIVKWASDNGYLDIIQRRLTDTRLLALQDAGVAFPPGLSLESFKKLSIRRSAAAKGK
jgi:hypothetical protein